MNIGIYIILGLTVILLISLICCAVYTHKAVKMQTALKELQDSHAKSQGITIIQCNVDGVEINRFASMAEAERFTGIWKTNIHRALKGLTNKAGGYIWKRF